MKPKRLDKVRHVDGREGIVYKVVDYGKSALFLPDGARFYDKVPLTDLIKIVIV